MNTKIVLTAIAIATALVLVVAPAMVEQPASAKKVELCPSGNECQGASGEHNPNTTCAAGKDFENTNANCP